MDANITCEGSFSVEVVKCQHHQLKCQSPEEQAEESALRLVTSSCGHAVQEGLPKEPMKTKMK